MSEDHPQSKATETQIQHTESHNGQISQTRWKRKKKKHLRLSFAMLKVDKSIILALSNKSNITFTEDFRAEAAKDKIFNQNLSLQQSRDS